MTLSGDDSNAYTYLYAVSAFLEVILMIASFVATYLHFRADYRRFSKVSLFHIAHTFYCVAFISYLGLEFCRLLALGLGWLEALPWRPPALPPEFSRTDYGLGNPVSFEYSLRWRV